MAPDKDPPDRQADRPEFEVAYFTRELGRDLQRRLLRQRLADFGKHGRAAAPGEHAAADGGGEPPGDDHAG